MAVTKKVEVGTRLVCANDDGKFVVDETFSGKTHSADAVARLCELEEVGQFAYHRFEPIEITDDE